MPGLRRWTRQNRPFVLVYHEVFEDTQSARKRELFLKSGTGRRWLDETIAKN